MAFLENLVRNGMVEPCAIAENARSCHKRDKKRVRRKTPAPEGTRRVLVKRTLMTRKDGTAYVGGAPKGAVIWDVNELL
jgi:hypothetical protein